MKEKWERAFFIWVCWCCFAIIFVIAKFAYDTTAEREDQRKWRWHKICKNNDKRAEFILNCAKAANPMSDEEGEDLVKQCEKTSYDLFCEYVKEYY